MLIEKVDVPHGVSGKWSIRGITVTEAMAEFDRLRSMFSGTGRFVPPGTYTGLFRGETIVMSDTPNELLDASSFVHWAEGQVLIAGLGLGCVPYALSKKPNVTSIDIVEISPDVIALVAPWLKSKTPKVNIIEGDINTWTPPQSPDESPPYWHHAWFDIWDNIIGDNKKHFARLRRRYAKYIGSPHFWCEREVNRQYNHDRRSRKPSPIKFP